MPAAGVAHGVTAARFLYYRDGAPAAVEFSYSDAHLAAYEEPTELTALAADASNPTWPQRVADIRKIPVELGKFKWSLHRLRWP